MVANSEPFLTKVEYRVMRTIEWMIRQDIDTNPSMIARACREQPRPLSEKNAFIVLRKLCEEKRYLRQVTRPTRVRIVRGLKVYCTSNAGDRALERMKKFYARKKPCSPAR